MEFYDFKLPPDEPDAFYGQFTWGKVDCDKDHELANSYNVGSWPTFQFVNKEGEITHEM
jgi:thioredoxin-related protein